MQVKNNTKYGYSNTINLSDLCVWGGGGGGGGDGSGVVNTNGMT